VCSVRTLGAVVPASGRPLPWLDRVLDQEGGIGE